MPDDVKPPKKTADMRAYQREYRKKNATLPVVASAIKQFDKMKDKHLFLATLTNEQRSQIQTIVEELVADTDGAWTRTEYVQMAIIAWFVERWDNATKTIDPNKLDPRTVDAIMRYRKTILDAMQSVRATRTKSDFFDRLKSFALEASKDEGTLRIEFETKKKEEKATIIDVPVLDVEPVEVAEDASQRKEDRGNS